jgi:hypothetical protein
MAACHWYDLTLVTHSWKVYSCIHCHLSFRLLLCRFVWNFIHILHWVHTNDADSRPSIGIGCWLAYFKTTSLSCVALSCLLLGIVGWVNLMIESFPFTVSVTICCLLDAYLDDCPILKTFAEKYIYLMIYHSYFLLRLWYIY